MSKSRWIEMLRLFNRIVNMEPHRLPQWIVTSALKSGAKVWLGDVIKVAHNLHLPLPTLFTFMYELDVARTTALNIERKSWKDDAM